MTEPQADDSIRLATPAATLPGVTKRQAQGLHRLGVRSVSDLLRHLPMRYEHEAAEDVIASLSPGVIGSARGMVVACQWVPSRGGWGGGRGGRKVRGRFVATLKDDTGRVSLTWFNMGYLRDKIHPGMTLRVQGKVKMYDGYPQIVNPKWESLDADAEAGAAPAREERLRPVYPATEGLPSTTIEQLITTVLPKVLTQISDPLPNDLLEHHNMPALAQAVRMVHQPEHQEEAGAARRRLAFNELLLLQLGIAMKRAYVQQRLTAPALHHSDAIDAHIKQRFPFELTDSQRRVISEIAEDLTRTHPMNRLLQGDVGAGKTVVALYALLLAVADRRQGAIMAPTELLAEQHYYSMSRMLEGSNVRVELMTAGQSIAGSAQRAAQLARIAVGEVDLVVGTQALLSEAVRFHNLALVVIDEQHRFGVMQRAAFRAGERDEGRGTREETRPSPLTPRPSPHHLVMTATPIPRTLSLTIFGDLDVSTIRGLPPGRTPTINRVVGPEKSDEVYRYITTRLARGEQAYVVVPAIDASSTPPLSESASEGAGNSAQLKSVREHTKLLQDKYFSDYRVAAIHGRLKRDTRERIMDRFRRNKIQVLVATTVIEVGVDVPNASVMVIEHAERFGLAQLHQLRGRIGRGTDGRRSLCVFIAQPVTDDAQQRMDAVASTNDGFRIAEMDLQIRGMGDFFGTRQSGLPPLRVARIPEDMDLLQLARRDAAALIEHDPDLSSADHLALHRVLMREYGEALGLIDIG